MRLPPDPVLLGAQRWLDILPTSGGLGRAQAILTSHRKYSDLTPTQYATALSWLHDVGLMESVGSAVPSASRLLSAIFENAAPPWFRDADELIATPEDLPSDILSVGETLGVNAVAVFTHVVASWGKVDIETRALVGAAGEAALAAALGKTEGAKVAHVALVSDGYGYDIEYSSSRIRGHLEVKSTNRIGRFTAYLSRHEHAVMQRDRDWVLVAVRLSRRLEIDAVGTVPRDWIEANVPQDLGSFGRWESAKLEIPDNVIAAGIPHLGARPNEGLPQWRKH